MNEFWGRVHFWGSFIFMNVVFMPMFAQGMEGMLRRMADGGANYSAARGAGRAGHAARPIMALHTWILWGAVALGLAQIPFIINLFWSIKHGEKVKSDNPWHSTTLEWQTPTPPPHGNFARPPHIYRGPYEYSVPGHDTDFTPQNEPETPVTRAENFTRTRRALTFSWKSPTLSNPGPTPAFTTPRSASGCFWRPK